MKIRTLIAAAAIAAATTSACTAKSTAAPQSPAATAGAAPAVPAAGPAATDVTLGKFTVDSIGVTVPVTVVNHSSKPSNYIVQFEVDNAAGTKIGDGIASTNNLAAGQKAELSGVAIITGNASAAVTVKLDKVDRYAS